MELDTDWLKSGFDEIFPAHVSAFVDLMVALRSDFDGDLDRMLIMAVIGDRRFSRRSAPVTYDELGLTPVRDGATVSINAHSIANFSGIPRETVRRKLASLIERGWVERDERGDLRPTRKAANALHNSTEATLTYLRAVAAACARSQAKR